MKKEQKILLPSPGVKLFFLDPMELATIPEGGRV